MPTPRRRFKLCEALTRSGKPCSMAALPTVRFCFTHRRLDQERQGEATLQSTLAWIKRKTKAQRARLDPGPLPSPLDQLEE